MQHIDVVAFGADFDALIAAVEKGETIILTRDDRAAAMLEPILDLSEDLCPVG
jgi:antitoxin (DNA-binding transcriptional repressor) of toxin-antitoxin stability system